MTATAHTDIQEINRVDLINNRTAIVDHFCTLSDEQMNLRFFKNMNQTMIEDWIDQITQSNRYEHLWLLVKSDEQIIGICQITYNEHAIAEIAISVVPDFQQRGIASFLMNAAISKIKNNELTQAISTIMVAFKRSNLSVRKLIMKYDFDLSLVQDEVIATFSV